MLDRLLEAIGVLVTQRRALVLVGLIGFAAALASQLTRLKSDPSPQKVVSAFENQDEILADLAETFGDAENVLLVLVEADDVLSKPAAQYIHDLSRRLEKVDKINKVASITATPLPHRTGPVEAVIDEDLERELMGIDDDGPPEKEGGGDEKNGEDEPLTTLDWKEQYGIDVATVQYIIDADPEHFPRGIFSLSQRAEEEGLKAGPIVKGDTVDEDELKAMVGVLEDSPLVRGQLVSADRKVAVIGLYLDLSLTEQKDVTASLDRVKGAIAEVEAPPGAKARLGGLPHMRDSLVNNIKKDQMTLNPLIGVVCFFVLLLTFRWLPGVLSPLVAVGMTALMVVGAMGLFDVRLNIITNIVPPLLIVIGISDSIHLIARYRDEVRRNGDRVKAGQTTVRYMAAACFLTSLTTAVGFGSLAIARTQMLREFGVIAAGGVILAYIVTIGFLPAVLTMVKPPKPVKKKDTRQSEWIERRVFAMTAQILRHPWRFIVAAVLVTGLGALAATRIDADVRLMDQFDEKDEVWEITHLLEDKLRGVRPLEVSMSADQEGRFYDPEVIGAIDSVAAWAEKEQGVIGTTSYSDLLHEVRVFATGEPKMRDAPFKTRDQVDALTQLTRQKGQDPLAPYLTKDGKRARLTISLADVGSNRSMVILDETEKRLHEALDGKGVRFQLTGEAYTGSRGRDAVLRDMVWGLLLAFGLIFGMLALLFRSIGLAIISIPPNVIPLVLTAAYMAIRGIPLNTATAITFSIGIGLAVDGTIHVLARYHEEHRKGLGVNVALLRAARGTGRAIVVTCATLALGFSVVMLSSFISVRQFGELISVTVLGILFGTLVAQPALLKVAGSRILRTY